MSASDVIIVGAGCFGLSTALSLAKRNYQVKIIDPTCSIEPYELASSTDISKLVRGDYGKNTLYADLTVDAIKEWRNWNQEHKEEIFHEVGIFVLAPKKLEEDPESFVSVSYEYMKNSPFYKVERLSKELQERYPQFNWNHFKDGYYNSTAGWANSSRACQVIREALQKLPNVKMINGSVTQILYSDIPWNEQQSTQGDADSQNTQPTHTCKVIGVRLQDQTILQCDKVIVAGGAFTPHLLPHLYQVITPKALLVAHFTGTGMENFTVDIADTGVYSFPYHPEAKVIKVARHTKGYLLNHQPITSSTLEPIMQSHKEQEGLNILRYYKHFVTQAPHDMRPIKFRMCTYCDTFDGDFLIDYDPERKGLFIASGGSGHGFKFMPILGEKIANIFENKPEPLAAHWKWRQKSTEQRGNGRTDPQIDRPGYDDTEIPPSKL